MASSTPNHASSQHAAAGSSKPANSRRTTGQNNGSANNGGGGGGGGGGGTQNSTLGGHTNGPHAHEGIEGMDWSTVPLSTLHAYRHAYRLPVPSASTTYHHLLLSQGIGRKAPCRLGYPTPSSASSSHNASSSFQSGNGSGSSSIGRATTTAGLSESGIIGGKGGRGRISKEQLATVVRKNFNAQPISEADVIVNFLYSVKNQDKTFRLRFPPR